MSASNYVGQRLSFDENLCTVRYVGEVEGTKGQWLGVEWDDPARGKHSGEHNGKQYFICLRSTPTSASFIRPIRKPDLTRTFIEALKYKYAPDSLIESGLLYTGKEDNSNTQTIRFGTKEAEEVGFDKIAQKLAHLQELRIVILDSLSISTKQTEPQSETSSIPETCPKINELDLSRNLFEEWREIASISAQLDRLTSLKIDGNRLRNTTLSSDETARFIRTFSTVTSLSLNDLLLPWPSIQDLTSTFTHLTTLSLSSNNLTSIPSPLNLPTLTDLTLEDNKFTSLSSLSPLTTLPNLTRLILKLNAISSIHPPHSPSSPSLLFPSLTTLDLSHNAIHTWSFLTSLPLHIPHLSSLRISHNPLFSNLTHPNGTPLSVETGYMLTIARLPSLKILNFSAVTPKDRLNAESYYLSLINAELGAADSSERQNILASHPRYASLAEEYGSTTPTPTSSAATINPNSLTARLVKLNLHLSPEIEHLRSTSSSPAHSASTAPPSPLTLELPKSLSTYAAIGQVGKKLGVSPLDIVLYWQTGEQEPQSSEDELSDWDPEDEWGEKAMDVEGKGKIGGEKEKVMRRVKIIPGTRKIGTWVEGGEADLWVAVREGL